ncbi:MAG: class I SAM-dependent methyltransferase [Isosphaeraceae bacterium]|nr:class I SAM-dependent methyltransferase [Isosphaeraceae bacterium]
MTNRDVDSFNARADRYDADFQGRRYHRPIQQAMVRIAARLAPAPRALLDVGCGTGSTLALFAAQYPAVALCGVDPAAEMLRVAQTRLGDNPRVRLLNAGAERLPFDDHAFDLVVSSNSFHHWADQGAGIREIGRVLAPGGHLVMTDPFAIGWNRWRARLRPHGRMRTKSEVETMLGAAGLSGVAWERIHVLGPLASYFVVADAPRAASTISLAAPARPA